jgi:hypothetical protein
MAHRAGHDREMNMSEKRYYFVASVTSVSGSQTYFADAESEDEARAMVERGDGIFECEEIEVQDLDPFELIGVQDVPNEA